MNGFEFSRQADFDNNNLYLLAKQRWAAKRKFARILRG